MITHSEVLSRVSADYEYPAIWTIEKLCSQDLKKSEQEYMTAYEKYKAAESEYTADDNLKNLHNKNWAAVKAAYAWARYMEKSAVHSDFMK